MPSSLPKSSDLYVKGLPGVSPQDAQGLSLFAGNLPAYDVAASQTSDKKSSAAENDAELYFLLARNRHIPNHSRFIIWLNGGPGCSSFDGAFIEIGPLKMNTHGKLTAVRGTAWNEYANVLFLDQPPGTGFSYAKSRKGFAHELDEAANDVVNFLANFYEVFPEFATMETYIAGESYAGQYIPYIAKAIQETAKINTNLKGLIIGNGWFSPRHQYKAYETYALESKLIPKGSKAAATLSASVASCMRKLDDMYESHPNGQGTILVSECENILGVLADAATAHYKSVHGSKEGDMCINMYDNRDYRPCGKEWPDEVQPLMKYLGQPDVVSALHAEAANTTWKQCSNAVSQSFWTPKSEPSVNLLPALLKTVPILLYSGDRDIICAGTGVLSMIEDLNWNGQVGFNNSLVHDWTVNATRVGTWQSARNLTFVNVFNASHMVPRDHPLAANDMLIRFMGVDMLHAAGPFAKIPSQIGGETETVLGETHPNGTSLQDSDTLDADEPASDQIDYTEPISDDGFDKEYEARYGPRRTAVLVLILLALGVFLWGFTRWRDYRRKSRLRRIKGKGKAPPSTANILRKKKYRHRTGSSSFPPETHRTNSMSSSSSRLSPDSDLENGKHIFSIDDEELDELEVASGDGDIAQLMTPTKGDDILPSKVWE